MDEKYPDQGAAPDNQDVGAGSGRNGTERSVAHLSQTGDARVDDAVAALSRLDGRPPEEHVAVLEEVHGRLRDILGELAESPEAPEGHEQR